MQHRLVGLLRQSVYSRLAGYEDTNDAERLAQDPTMRISRWTAETLDRSAASTNTMSRFETEVLTQDGNVEGLGRLNAEWVDGAMSRTPHRRVILDMDSSESPVHGEQEGASYNGHFGSTCYHPLFVFNQFGDCEGAMLRAGNVHSAHEWRACIGSDPVPLRGDRECGGTFVPMPHSPSRTSMSTWRSGESSTPYGCRATRCCNTGDRSTAAQEAGGQAAEASGDPIRRLLVSCRELGPRSAGGGEGGVA